MTINSMLRSMLDDIPYDDNDDDANDNMRLSNFLRRHRMVNRTICDVFEEMRSAHKTRNFSYLLGLIEEAQTMANRMESALEDNYDIQSLQETKTHLEKSLKTAIKELRANISEVKGNTKSEDA